ncbi:MAG TPA: GNAT family N-acetyltransferase [Candidatus Acidoferrum sp.]|jgi:GNAT superfamily N-acetyltransferase|nr:GNAT family N-acetyltransferase [Candidatus Acidoferrum sp.]
MEYPLLSLELAREIEIAEAEAAIGCAGRLMAAQGDGAGAIASVAGGYAVYCGANSPVTQAVGLGLNGAVSKEEFDRLEEFYFSRQEPVRVETCPMADGSLIGHYRERGYHVSEFSNVMVRPVEKAAAGALPAGIEIRKMADGEVDLWTLTVAQGFAEHFPVTQELLGVMRLFASGKNTECYFAWVDGKIAGGATLALRGRIAGLFGASTLPQFRNRGVQTALLHARMQRAAEQGCELAMSLAVPGSASQRNITRQGFQTSYTRVKFERPFTGENGA